MVPVYENQHHSIYSLLISEFEQEHSYLDQVQLWAVDHEFCVNVAVSPLGEVLTYQDAHVPKSVVDEHGTSWLQEVNDVNGNYYEGYNGSFLVLDFGEVSTPDAKLVMRADRPITKKSIHIQVLDSAENWIDVVSVIPRTFWATEIIDLSGHMPSSGDLEVRLYFTDSHKVDFVGLDMTPLLRLTSKRPNCYWPITPAMDPLLYNYSVTTISTLNWFLGSESRSYLARLHQADSNEHSRYA